MAIHRHHYRLPPKYYEHIGEVVSEWNFTEALISSIIWKLHRISDVRKGRVLIYGLQARDKLRILARSAKFTKSKPISDELMQLQARASRLCNSRNLLAHGLWGHKPNEKLWKVFKMGDIDEDLLMIRHEVRPEDLQPEKIAKDIRVLNTDLRRFMTRNRIPPP